MTNSRFEDLEKRAKKIEFKRIFKFVSLVAILSCLAVSLMYITQNKNKKIILVDKGHEQVEIKKEEIKKIITQEDVKKESIKEDLIINKDMQNKEALYDTQTLELNVKQSNRKSKIARNEKKVVPTIKIVDLDEKQFFSLKVKSVNEEEVLLRDFDAKKDYISAMKLANLYYQNRSYEKSIYWTKEASRINPGSSEPWIIYARSKNKLGLNDDAIIALEKYLVFFSSTTASNLLIKLKEIKK